MRKMLQGMLCLGVLVAVPALAEETGTRVEVKSASTSPEAEKMVQSLSTLGSGERQVKVLRKKSDGGEVTTIDLWGGTIPQSEIAATLKQSFPELASAEISVSTIPASEKPALDADALRSTDGKNVRKRIIRKEVVEQK